MKKEKKKKKSFAIVAWTVEDIKTLRPKWTEERCEAFLVANERHIQDGLIELGWEVIEILL